MSTGPFSRPPMLLCQRTGYVCGLRWGILLILLTLPIGAVAPLWAAVELVSLQVTPLNDRVRIEWETAREYDVAAFQLFYKREEEPVTAYQRIGQPIAAQGDLQSGALYQAEFFQLQPSVSYCFRLVEVTTNQEPGDVFERCGYGIGTSPTPTPTPTVLFTPTPEFIATLEATETPFFAPELDQTVDSPLATPTPENEGNGGVIVNFQTPVPAPDQPLDVGPEVAPGYLVQTATPTPTPLLVPPTPTPLPTATPTPAFGGFGLGRLLDGPGAAPGALTEVLLILLCLGSVGLALLGVMTLLGSIFYLRSRL